MASKLEQFLKEKGIDPRRVLVASRAIEALRPEDRLLKHAQRRAKGVEGGAKKEAPSEAKPRPRSGRPVNERLLRDATAGKPVTGPEKTRLLRAINRLLEQKQQPPVDLRALF
ncbi:MAG TPA: hypothetical protein PLU22_09980 [Polyangiaceae bacterium]|nr:hypothetical protein [Polyangiaceae bacterium]